MREEDIKKIAEEVARIMRAKEDAAPKGQKSLPPEGRVTMGSAGKVFSGPLVGGQSAGQSPAPKRNPDCRLERTPVPGPARAATRLTISPPSR